MRYKLVEVSSKMPNLPKIVWSVKAKRLIIKGRNVNYDAEAYWPVQFNIHEDRTISLFFNQEKESDTQVVLGFPLDIYYSQDGTIYRVTIRRRKKPHRGDLDIRTQAHVKGKDNEWKTIDTFTLKAFNNRTLRAVG